MQLDESTEFQDSEEEQNVSVASTSRIPKKARTVPETIRRGTLDDLYDSNELSFPVHAKEDFRLLGESLIGWIGSHDQLFDHDKEANFENLP